MKLKRSDYKTAAQSRRPGYLARRMKEYAKREQTLPANVAPIRKKNAG